MAKALYGTATMPSQLKMLDEIRALRQRVAALEAALDEARRAGEQPTDLEVVVENEPVSA